MIHSLALLITCMATWQEERRSPIEAQRQVATSVPVNAELRLHDIRSLTGDDEFARLLDETKSWGTVLAGSYEHDQLDQLQLLRDRSRTTAECVSRAIQDIMQPAFEEGQRIEPLPGGALAVIASPEQHAWLETYLNDVSTVEGMIDIEAHIHLLEPGQLSKLGQERSGQIVNEVEAEDLLRKLRELGPLHITAPRLIVYPFERAELMAVEQLPYVQDYQLQTFPGQDVEIADPVIGIAEDGVKLKLRCVPLPGGHLSIDAHLHYSTVTRPIPTLETTIGAGGHRVTIQTPEILNVQLEGRFEIRPSETLIMSSTDSSSQREVMVLVRVTRVPKISEER